MILAILDVLECGEKPPCPALLLAAGDEESSMTGIQRFIETAPPLARAVFGEPTSLCPIVQHKGIARWDITVHGKSAHSSQPELGCDAIAGAVQVLDALRRHQEELRNRQVNPRMSGPSITVTMIQGGRTRNALADQCTLSVDFRVLPGMSSPEARAELIASLSPLGLQLSHSDMQLCSPPLNTDPDGPFAQAVLEICRRATGQPHLEPAGVPYGTDAAWVSHLAPAVVLGPGSIEVAHAVDEFVDLDEVVQCARIYHEILMSET
jgi:acetylornithine deacetylase